MSIKKIFTVLSIFLLIAACKTNPFTGERNLNFVSNSQIFPMAFQQYNQFLAENEVEIGTSRARMVKEVGRKIATAAERYLNSNGYESYLEEYEWEYNLVKDETVNAWAMPGGKIVMYTGILPVAETETGVAAIMAHEVAHALANHGAQRMSAAQLQQLGAVAGTVALGGESEETQQLFSTAYGIGTQYGLMMPFSRGHESEADRIGLTLMAIAGYDPREAADLWRRMSENSEAAAPPEFLSTHPSHETRIRNIEKWAPGAIAEAEKYGVTSFQ